MFFDRFLRKGNYEYTIKNCTTPMTIHKPEENMTSDVYDIQAIAKTVAKNHEPHCLTKSEYVPDVWIGDVTEATPFRGRNRLEVHAECQNCMRGCYMVIFDKPEFHIHKEPKTVKRHRAS